MKFFLFLCPLLFALQANQTAAQTLAKVSSGRLERISNFPSKFVDARHVEVWLPDGYPDGKPYKVLYMHDGQMLFDASTTWNKQAWNVDASLADLIAKKAVANTIIVGIWNNGKFRHSEYFPQKFLTTVGEPVRSQFIKDYLQNKPQSDNYLKFIVQELKPYIDQHYATRPEKEHTSMMGSSMGGMISVYAMNEYPEVFGSVAGVSVAWISMGKANFELPLAAFNYLQRHLASPEDHKLYMDHGTTEMDQWYGTYQQFVDEIVRDKGYTSANWRSMQFEKTGHNENDWAKRVAIPLQFLLSTNKPQ